MGRPMMGRREFIAQVVGQGWSITGADEGFVTAEADGRWMLVGWCASGMLGALELFDAETKAELFVSAPTTVPSPGEAATRLRATQ